MLYLVFAFNKVKPGDTGQCLKECSASSCGLIWAAGQNYEKHGPSSQYLGDTTQLTDIQNLCTKTQNWSCQAEPDCGRMLWCWFVPGAGPATWSQDRDTSVYTCPGSLHHKLPSVQLQTNINIKHHRLQQDFQLRYLPTARGPGINLKH